jgi:hypothetical protein
LKYIGIFLLFLLSCSDNGVTVGGKSDTLVLQRIIADTSNNIAAQVELEEYDIKKLLCVELGIYDIENSKDSIEVRLWHEPSMWEPHELFIIRGKDTSWKALRYVFYQRRNNFETEDYKYWDAHKQPIIDSFKAESLFPGNMGWEQYVASLQIDSLWNFPSQSELEGDFGCLDGSGHTIEIKDRHRYKAFRYRCPRGREEPHHQRFTRIIDNIEAPLFYDGIKKYL